VVTRGWNGYRNKSQHRKSTLEKKILPPFQQGFEPATFQSRVRYSNHWAIPAPISRRGSVLPFGQYSLLVSIPFRSIFSFGQYSLLVSISCCMIGLSTGKTCDYMASVPNSPALGVGKCMLTNRAALLMRHIRLNIVERETRQHVGLQCDYHSSHPDYG